MLPHTISIILAIVACAVAKPSGIVPIVGPPGVVTAHSHQFVARTYNGIVTVPTPPVHLLPPIATPIAPRFYPTTLSYVPNYPAGYYPYNPVYRYGYNYPWGAYGPTYVRYPLNPYW